MPTFLTRLPLDEFDYWFHSGVRGSVYLIGAALVTFLLGKLFVRMRQISANLIRERGGPEEMEWEKQSETIASIARRGVFFFIWALAIVLALKEFRFDVAPILAGAGVAGLAVGFAAQSILKDWISGFFLLTEGQVRINDIIKIGEISGAVEKLTMRTTVLRGYDGTAHVFNNGSFQSFSNLTMGHSYAVFDIGVQYEDDPERLMAVLTELGGELQADPEWRGLLKEPMEIAGVDAFTQQGIVVKARIKTLPSQQWRVRRELMRRVHQRCAERGIAIATAQRTFHLFERGGTHDSDPDQPSRRP